MTWNVDLININIITFLINLFVWLGLFHNWLSKFYKNGLDICLIFLVYVFLFMLLSCSFIFFVYGVCTESTVKHQYFTTIHASFVGNDQIGFRVRPYREEKRRSTVGASGEGCGSRLEECRGWRDGPRRHDPGRFDGTSSGSQDKSKCCNRY